MDCLPQNTQKALNQSDFEDDIIDIIDHPVIKTLISFVSGAPLVTSPLIDLVTWTWRNMSKQKSNVFFVS